MLTQNQLNTNLAGSRVAYSLYDEARVYCRGSAPAEGDKVKAAMRNSQNSDELGMNFQCLTNNNKMKGLLPI